MSRLQYCFGPYTLADSGRVLSRNGETVAATPKVRAILLVLVQAGGNAVSKDELLRAVWPDSFVEEGNLTQSVSVLRKLLARDYPDGGPIETIAKFGYRFSAPVELRQEVRASGEGLEEFNERPETLATGAVERDSMGQELAVELTGPKPEAGAAGGEGRTWLLWCVPIVVVLVALLLLHGRRVVTGGMKVDFEQLSTNTDENRVTAAAISPDGRLVAYADEDGVVLRGRNAVATRTLRTPGIRSIERMAWSADGIHLLTSGTGEDGVLRIWTLSTEAGVERVLLEHAKLGALSPDGSRVAYVTDRENEVWVTDSRGGNASRLLSGSSNDSFPALLWSGDGRRVLLERHAALQTAGHLHSQRTEDDVEGFHATYLAVDAGDGRITATEDSIRIGDACLLSGGRMLFSRSEDTDYGKASSFWIVSLNAETGAFNAAPERIRARESLHVLSLSSSTQTGAMVGVFRHGRPGIYVGSLSLPKGTLDHVKLLTTNGSEGGPHGWTPDGRAVLFESNHGDKRYHIYKQELGRREPESLTANMGGEAIPRMMPDGLSVMFQTRGKGGSILLWRVALSGGNPVLVSEGDHTNEFRCAVTGSGCVLGARTADDRHFAFWALDPMHGKGRKLFEVPVSWKAFGDWDLSPDGTEVVTVSRFSAQPELRVIKLATGTTQEVLIPIASPVSAVNWVPTGKGWILASLTARGNELLYVDPKGAAKVLRETATSTWGVPSRDGSKLAFADENVDSNAWFLITAR